MDGGQDEFLLLGGGEDFVEVDRHAERDEEEAADAGADPVGGLERWWGDELRPERVAALAEEDGARVVWVEGNAGDGWGGGVDVVDIGLCGSGDVVEGAELAKVKNRL